MTNYRISYVVTTYNKLPYLRQVMERLVAARQPDEEIVVADGGSKDGTPAYLQKFFEAGQIQQYVSERDKGEAHGFNKGMLMARGELIKIITDDDAFCYEAIREAAAFMLAHPTVDVLAANSGRVFLEKLDTVEIYNYNINNYLAYYHKGVVTHLIGLPLIIRRAALALTGLFNTAVVLVDSEFTSRITALKVSIAWSSALLSIRLDNPQSNFRNLEQHLRQDEDDRIRYFYDKAFLNDPVSILRQRIPFGEWLKKPVRPAKKAVFRLLKLPQWEAEAVSSIPTNYFPNQLEDPIAAAFRIADACMANYNEQHPTTFLVKSQTAEIAKVMPVAK